MLEEVTQQIAQLQNELRKCKELLVYSVFFLNRLEDRQAISLKNKIREYIMLQPRNYQEFYLMRDGALIITAYPFYIKLHGGWQAIVAKIRIYSK